MTRRFESKIKMGFAGVALILAFIVALAIANSTQLRNASEATDRSQETLRELERLLVTMVDAETGMRGYVITGEESYLEPYQRAIATIESRLSHLKRLLEETRVDGQFDELQKAVRSQLAFRKTVVETIRAGGGSETVRRSIRIGEGKRGMDEIRRIVARLEQN